MSRTIIENIPKGVSRIVREKMRVNRSKQPIQPRVFHSINKKCLDIIIPCVGFDKRLAVLLATLEKQTFQKFRLIVVGTYAGPQTRIDKMVRVDFQDDKSKMLNTGISQGFSELVCTLDADACLPPAFLEESLKQIKDDRLYLPVRRDISQADTEALLAGQEIDYKINSKPTGYPADLPIGFCFFFCRARWLRRKFRETGPKGPHYAGTDTEFARKYGLSWVRLNTIAYHQWHDYLFGGARKERDY